MSKTTHSKQLRDLREGLGLTQRQLAREFKVSHGAVAHWESGKRKIPGPILRLIEIYSNGIRIAGVG